MLKPLPRFQIETIHAPYPARYKERFNYWRSWHRELIQHLGKNVKRERRDLKETRRHLEALAKYVKEEQAQEVKDKGLTFPVAYGATKADGDLIGAWWSEDRGGYIQPSEFLMGRGGVVLGSMYASGPVGRMGADEAIRQITRRENIRREDEGAAAH